MPETAVLETLDVEALSRKTFLRPHQREELQREIQTLEWALKGHSMHDGRPMPHFATDADPADPEVLQESLERNQSMLQRHDPLAVNVDPMVKNRLYRLMRDLEGKIQADMPSYEMMERPTPVNVDWHMAWEKTHKKNVLAWKAIRRILEPNNTEPNFTNVELLRRSEHPKGDPRKYWQHFEEISFSERVEEEINQLSDEQYLEFLKLKALEWSAVTICKQLGWHRETYELAMARLRGAVPEPPAYDSGMDTEVDIDEPVYGAEAASPVVSARDTSADSMQPFGPWLKAELDRRQIIKKDFAAKLGVRLDQLYQGMSGKRRFTADVPARATALLAQFDQNQAVLRVHEN